MGSTAACAFRCPAAPLPPVQLPAVHAAAVSSSAGRASPRRTAAPPPASETERGLSSSRPQQPSVPFSPLSRPVLELFLLKPRIRLCSAQSSPTMPQSGRASPSPGLQQRHQGARVCPRVQARVCVRTHVQVCMWVCVSGDEDMRTCVCVYCSACACRCVCVRMHTRVDACVHVCGHLGLRVCVHAHVPGGPILPAAAGTTDQGGGPGKPPRPASRPGACGKHGNGHKPGVCRPVLWHRLLPGSSLPPAS